MILERLEKCRRFSDSQYGFRFSNLTVDLLTVVSDRITRTHNKHDATCPAAHDISIALTLVFCTTLGLMAFQVSPSVFFCLFMVLDGIE